MRIALTLSYIFITFVIFGQSPKITKYERKNYTQFTENKGQWEGDFKVKAELNGGFVYLRSSDIKFQLYSQKDFLKASLRHSHTKSYFLNHPLNWHSYTLNFKNANVFRWQGESALPGFNNYFLGNDTSKWVSKLKSYSSYMAENVYNGVDMIVYGSEGNFKYDFIIAPGVNPDIIKWNYNGVENVVLKREQIKLTTSVGHVLELSPYAYQIIDGVKKVVDCDYTFNGADYGFSFPNGFHTGYELVIDPIVSFSTYSGSGSDNFGYTATYDSYGFLYSGSSAFGNAYVTTIGAYQSVFGGGTVDIAITKYDTTGTQRIYSTFIGGNGNELPHSMIVNSNDELFIYGTSSSSDYPTSNSAFQKTYVPGGSTTMRGIGFNYSTGADIVITRLDNSGSRIIASTYLGGDDIDGVNTSSDLLFNYADEIRGEIILNQQEEVLIATSSKSTNLPVIGSNGLAYNGGEQDGYVAKLDNYLSSIIWSSYVGGSLDDGAYGLGLDENDNLFVTGGTSSSDFATTFLAYQENIVINRASGYIVKFNQSGQAIRSTYYGADNVFSQCYFVDADRDGAIYVYGQAVNGGSNFQENATFGNPDGGMIISKFNNNLTQRFWSTSFGGNDGGVKISPTAFLVDVCSKIFLSGWGGATNRNFAGVPGSTTTGLEVTPDAFQSTTDGNDFYIMVMEDDASALVYATFFGGATSGEHVDGGTSRFSKNGVVYQSVCAGCGGNSDFPIIPLNAVSPTNNSSNCNNAVFKIDFEINTVIADFKTTNVCLPDTVKFENLSKNGITYEWDFGDGSASSSAGNPTHFYDEGGIYPVKLISTNNGVCNAADTITKFVVVQENLSTTLPELELCKGDAVSIGPANLNVDTLTTFEWTPNYKLSNTEGINPTAEPDVTTNYRLLYSNGICTDTMYQTVNVTNAISKVPDEVRLCEPTDSLYLVIEPEHPDAGVTWYDEEELITVLSYNRDSMRMAASENRSVYVVTEHGNCEYLREIPIYIDDMGLVVTEDILLCDNDNYRLSALATGGNSGVYNYSVNPLNIQTNQVVDTLFVPQTFGWYYIYAEDNLSKCPVEDSVFIGNINEFYTQFQDTIVCEGDTFTLLAQPQFNYPQLGTGEWKPDELIIDELNDFSIITRVNSTQQFYFTAYSSDHACSYKDTLTVTLYNPEIETNGTISICGGDTVPLIVKNTSSDGSIFTYEWKPKQWIVGDDKRDTVFVSPKEITDFFVEATSQHGCVTLDTVRVSFFDELGLQVSEDKFICEGDTAILVVNNPLGSNISYKWSPIDHVVNGDFLNDTIYVTPDKSTFYTLEADNGTDCNSLYGVDVIVNTDQLIVPNDTIICYGQTLRLDVKNKYPNYPVTMVWEGHQSILSDTNKTFIIVKPEVTTTYTFKASRENCVFEESITVEVSKFDISLPTSLRYCKDESVTVTVVNNDPTQTLSYEWNTNVEYLTPDDEATVSILPSKDTQLHLYVTNQHGCRGNYFIPVTISKPYLEIPIDTIACQSDVIQLEAINENVLDVFTYAWSGLGAQPPLNQATLNVQVQQSHYIYFEGENQIGCKYADSVFVVLIDDLVNTTANREMCVGDEIWLQVNPTYQDFNLDYQWSGVDILENKTDSILVAPATSTNYTVNVVVSDNCTYSENINVTAYNLDVDVSSNVLICDGSSTLLTATDVSNNGLSSTFSWFPNDGVGSNSSNYNVTPNASTQYILTTENTKGCKRADTVTVAILSELSSVVGSHFSCYGDTVTLVAKNEFPEFTVDFSWYLSNPDNTILGTTNDDTLIVVVDSTFKAILTTTHPTDGCEVKDSLLVQTSKISLNIPDSLIACENDTAVAFANNILNESLWYYWEYDGVVLNGFNTDSLAFIVEDGKEVILHTENNIGCFRSDTIPVRASVVKYTKGNNLLLCPNTQGNLFVTNNYASDVLTYSWSPNEFITSSSSQANIIVAPDSTTMFYVSMINQYGCIAIDSALVVLTNDMLSVNADTTMCLEDEIEISVVNLYPEFNLTYNWEPQSEIISGANTNQITVSPEQETQYEITVTNGLNCNYEDTVTVNISSVSEQSFEAFTLKDTVNYGGITTIYSEPYFLEYNYTWEPKELLSSPENVRTEATLFESTNFTGTVSDGYCFKAYNVFVFVEQFVCGEPNIYVPNAFTPNGDGDNDLLFLRGNYLEEVDFKVYTRWGELVFSTEDVKIGWDGTFKGKILEPDVYVYHLNVTCTNKVTYAAKGNVTLIR